MKRVLGNVSQEILPSLNQHRLHLGTDRVNETCRVCRASASYLRAGETPSFLDTCYNTPPSP
jgi:hypothetical protein